MIASARVSVPCAYGRWAQRVCDGCDSLRMMPTREIFCCRCEPDGSPRSWRIMGLRQARLLEERSTDGLAEAAGVSVATIRRAERGRFRTATAVRIATALKTSVAELTTDEDREG